MFSWIINVIAGILWCLVYIKHSNVAAEKTCNIVSCMQLGEEPCNIASCILTDLLKEIVIIGHISLLSHRSTLTFALLGPSVNL